MEKRPLPVTSCTNCGAVGYNIALANRPCGRTVNKKRCKGINQSAIGTNDWKECPTCKGSGWQGGNMCSRCWGAGWLFVGQRL